MSAREEVLAAVRAALAGVTPVERPGRVPRPPAAGGAPASRASAGPGGADGPEPDRVALLDLFAERVGDYRADVTRAHPTDVPAAVAAALGDARRVLLPDGLETPTAADLGPGREAVRDTGLSAAELDDVDAVVTTSALGIAVTGTVVLDHGPGQGRRALTLVPDRHVCLVAAASVVADVPDAVARLDPARPQTWVSGPSATSDIELDRVEGVHGPRHLHVVLVTP